MYVQVGALYVSGVNTAGRDRGLLKCSDDGGGVQELREREPEALQGLYDLRGFLSRESDEEAVRLPCGSVGRGVVFQAMRRLPADT